MEGLMSEYYLSMIEQSENENSIFESMCTCDYMELQCVDEAVLTEGVKDVIQKIKQIIRNIVNAVVKFFNAIAFAIKKKNIETSKEFTELVKKSKDIMKSGNFKKTNHMPYYGDILGGKEFKTGFTKRMQMDSAAILSIQGLLANFDKNPKIGNNMHYHMMKTYIDKIEKILEDYEKDFDDDSDSKAICKLLDPHNNITADLKASYNIIMNKIKDPDTFLYMKSDFNDFNTVMEYLSKYLSLKSRLSRNYGLVLGLNYILPAEASIIIKNKDTTINKDIGTAQADNIKQNYLGAVNSEEEMKPLDSIKYINAMEAAYKAISLKLLTSTKESKQFEQGLQKVMNHIDKFTANTEADNLTTIYVPVLNFAKQYIEYKTSCAKGMYEGVLYGGDAHIRRIMKNLRDFVRANTNSNSDSTKNTK